jgi:hypothetical protein
LLAASAGWMGRALLSCIHHKIGHPSGAAASTTAVCWAPQEQGPHHQHHSLQGPQAAGRLLTALHVHDF